MTFAVEVLEYWLANDVDNRWEVAGRVVGEFFFLFGLLLRVLGVLVDVD